MRVRSAACNPGVPRPSARLGAGRSRSLAIVAVAMACVAGPTACRRRGQNGSVGGTGEIQVVGERLSPELDDGGFSATTAGTLRYEISIDGSLREGERFTVAWVCENCAAMPGRDAPIASADVSLTRAMLGSRPVIVAGELSRPESGWVEGTYRVDVMRGGVRWRQFRFNVRP